MLVTVPVAREPLIHLHFVSSLKARISVYLSEQCSGWKYQFRCLAL